QFKEGELIKGLDKTRLLGIAATLPEREGAPPSAVAAIPVTDFGQFLDSLKVFGVKVDDKSGVPGFSHKVSTPDGSQSVFALHSGHYAFFSLLPTGADQIRALDPATWK